MNFHLQFHRKPVFKFATIKRYTMGNDNANKNASPLWMEIVSKYNFSNPVKSWWQVINSVVPYLLLWAIMIWSLSISYWLTLLLSVVAAGFLIRIFIIFHDCGHGSFFKSQRLNRIVGVITGLMAFTPYHKWHHDHKEHHATVGNLDKRGTGDVKNTHSGGIPETIEMATFYVPFLQAPYLSVWYCAIPCFCFSKPVTKSLYEQEGTFVPSPYKSGINSCNCAVHMGYRMESLSFDTIAYTIHCFSAWSLAILRSASVRKCGMDAWQRVELQKCRFRRKFLSQTAPPTAMVYRQYWVSPYSSPGSTNSQL